MRSLLAHQGGWDEFLVLLSPLPILVALRLLERRRANRHDGDDETASPPGDHTTSTS